MRQRISGFDVRSSRSAYEVRHTGQRRALHPSGVGFRLPIRHGRPGERTPDLPRVFLPRRGQQRDPPDRAAAGRPPYREPLVETRGRARHRSGRVRGGRAAPRHQGRDSGQGLPYFGPRPAGRGGNPGRPSRGLRRLTGCVMSELTGGGEMQEETSGIIKKFMFVNRRAPPGTVYALEALEVVLISAAFDQDISMVFLDDGVYELVKGQQTKAIDVKNFSPAYRALDGYDIEKLYVDADSLAARGLTEDNLLVPVG